MEKLRAIVVDDEMPSREALGTYIKDFCQELEVVAECDCIKAAYKAIIEYQPEIVFLDIEMPNGNGFDLLQMFDKPDFKVIFVTAYSEYAIKAFRFSAADYLLKPVKVDELLESVRKVKSEIEAKSKSQNNFHTLLENINDPDHIKSIVIPDISGFKVLSLDDIIMCEADSYCTVFYLKNKVEIMSSKNLKHYEELLNESGFQRVNRAFLINFVHVKGYNNQGIINLSEGLNCPLGDNYKLQFMRRFKGMK